MTDYIHIKVSAIHGKGIFAKRHIPEGAQIIEYKGNKITKNKADKILEATNNDATVYIFALNKRHDLDGNVDWNDARYINHSCEPNCRSEIDSGRIWIVAARQILPGEELTYDYHFARLGWNERPCRCSAKECFGYIVSKSHWTSIRKTKRYQENQTVIKIKRL